LLIVQGAVFVYSGIYNVGAGTGHTKLVDQALNFAMMRSVRKRPTQCLSVVA